MLNKKPISKTVDSNFLILIKFYYSFFYKLPKTSKKVSLAKDMKLGYISFPIIEGTIRSGILITDESTRPIEFRAVSDVKIDKLQKILYGETLQQTFLKEQYTIDLVNAIENLPDILLTQDKELLNVRPKLPIPVGFLTKLDPMQAIDRFSHKISDITGKFETLMLTMHPFDERLVVPISKQLQTIYKNFNLLEPFHRIETAIKYLAEEKE